MGKQKVEGSGRKAGTPNKSTLILQQILEEKGLDPIQGIIDSLRELDSIVSYEPADHISIALGKAKIHLELLSYLFPKRKAIETIEIKPEPAIAMKSYPEFCEAAGYPTPYPKQIEMMEFGMNSEGARLLLGSRGYGKTDYVVILGIAYRIYLDRTFTALIVTKSDERNASMLNEIAKALESNGMALEKHNASTVRVEGLIGKDNSVSAVTVGTSSLRGRHPKLVVMDDPVTDEDVSEATRRRVQRVYNEVSKLCQDVLVIGQPVHKYDLYETLRPLLEKMEVPHGSIPELDHDLEAQRLAGVDEGSIQASYFLKVGTEGTTPFDKIQYMDSFPSGGSSVAFIDPSDGGNDTAISIFKQHMQGIAVVGFTWKKSWHHCLDDMLPLFQRYGVARLCFETNKHGQQPLDVLRQVYPNIGVVGKHSSSNKHSRIMAAGTYSHMIFLSKESNKNYIDHVVKYEYGAKIDDAPDSLATGLEWIGLIRGK
jgi:hypothetical protein